MTPATKALENARNIIEMSRGWGQFIGLGPAWAEPEASNFAHCPNFAADPARGAVAALSGDAVLPDRPSGIGADGLALAQGCAGVPAMGRFQRDFDLPAALGGGLRRRQILQPSRGRLGRAAGCDRRCRGW